MNATRIMLILLLAGGGLLCGFGFVGLMAFKASAAAAVVGMAAVGLLVMAWALAQQGEDDTWRKP